MGMFRKLRADEIDCRVAQINQNGLSLLLYKDARCDMNILDETVGEYNWKREHVRDNANCVVSIWDKDKSQWVSKEDTGTESFTEKEKGLASDSFKRACFNWGIGRELYTAPFIWIPSSKCKIVPGKNNKPACYDRFIVSHIQYEGDKICYLSINSANGTVYTWGTPKRTHLEELRSYCIEHRLSFLEIGREFGFGKDTNDDDYMRALDILKKRGASHESA